MTRKEVNKQIRQSLGLPPKPEPVPTVPQEGHICDFPIWSYSKKRSTITKLVITYEDGSFFHLEAPKGLPGVTSPGYLDVLLYFGQRDLFWQNFVELSAYSVMKHLHIDPDHGSSYSNFVRDMERNFALMTKTDRFIDPATRQRTHVTYFRVLDTMKLARHRKGVSRFYFNQIFLESLRSGYLKRLDYDFCLYLDRRKEPLARFLYAHLLKRIGEKSLYTRRITGFLNDIGMEFVSALPLMRRNERLKRVILPALELVKGHAFRHYEVDDQDNIVFFHK
jgi:hypothetical protein